MYRAIFRACWRAYSNAFRRDGFTRKVRFEKSPGVERSTTWRRSNEDYICDFTLAGQRSLPGTLYEVFRIFHLGRGTATRARSKRGIEEQSIEKMLPSLGKHNSQTIHHAFREIERIVGQAIADMQPYSLYPPAEYFRATNPGERHEKETQLTEQQHPR